MVCTWTLFQREKPLRDTVTHDLLQVLEAATTIKGVFAGKGMKDGEDVALCCGYFVDLWLGGRCECGGFWRVGYHAEGGGPWGISYPESFQEVVRDSDGEGPDDGAAVEVFDGGEVEDGHLDRAEGHACSEKAKEGAPTANQRRSIIYRWAILTVQCKHTNGR